jgi:hypothetical protein
VERALLPAAFDLLCIPIMRHDVISLQNCDPEEGVLRPTKDPYAAGNLPVPVPALIF